ncbi:hypothetical protein DM02DRAFT_634795 [Periconia macrospinosa]|uniref:Uncharacterized protein n=1 Tax=Periconia macrospinosa TaxID=97972 RepID=A0A2V1D587_9PLEO|nr:hypothetical protein DM02DRAFT_634795 [Periconia macrospinosa]
MQSAYDNERARSMILKGRLANPYERDKEGRLKNPDVEWAAYTMAAFDQFMQLRNTFNFKEMHRLLIANHVFSKVVPNPKRPDTIIVNGRSQRTLNITAISPIYLYAVNILHATVKSNSQSLAHPDIDRKDKKAVGERAQAEVPSMPYILNDDDVAGGDLNDEMVD